MIIKWTLWCDSLSCKIHLPTISFHKINFDSKHRLSNTIQCNNVLNNELCLHLIAVSQTKSWSNAIHTRWHTHTNIHFHLEMIWLLRIKPKLTKYFVHQFFGPLFFFFLVFCVWWSECLTIGSVITCFLVWMSENQRRRVVIEHKSIVKPTMIYCMQ